MSIVAGVAVGLFSHVLILAILGAARAPLHLVFVLLALGIGIAVGVSTARRVERREDRLDAARGNATSF